MFCWFDFFPFVSFFPICPPFLTILRVFWSRNQTYCSCIPDPWPFLFWGWVICQYWHHLGVGRLQSMGSLRVGHDWMTSISLSTFMHWRRKWQPTPVFLPGESHGRRSLVGCSPLGSHRVGYDWSNLAAASTIKAINLENGFWTFFMWNPVEGCLFLKSN